MRSFIKGIFSFVMIASLLLVLNITKIMFVDPNINGQISQLSNMAEQNAIEKSYIQDVLDAMPLRQKIASMLILHKSGTNSVTLVDYLNTYKPGGLIFMSDNIPTSDDETKKMTEILQSNTPLPYLFAIDQEGGVVSRIDSDALPGAFNLRNQNPSITQSTFNDRSRMLKNLGFNLNFGIVADVTNNSNSFIYPRVFGGDATSVAARVSAAVEGSKGLTLSTLKHFPGHGETADDSHSSVPITNASYQKWQQNDELPFAEGIKSGANFVMFGHLIYSEYDNTPASLSAKWHKLLVNQEKLKGISITDDMIMLQESGDPKYADPVVNAVSAIKAGNNMLLYVLDHGGKSGIDPNVIIDGIETAVNNGTLDRKLININASKVFHLRHDLNKVLNK